MKKADPVRVKQVKQNCDYCKAPMRIVIEEVKRPVPPGAKDLNLRDTITHWRCTQCNLTSKNQLQQCGCGRVRIFGRPELETAQQSVKAGLVQPPMAIGTLAATSEFEGRTECTSCTKCRICELPLESYDLFVVYDRPNFDYYHKNCLEESWRQEEQRRAAEQQAEEQRRIKLKLCLSCGNPLGLMDKMAGRSKHTGC